MSRSLVSGVIAAVVAVLGVAAPIRGQEAIDRSVELGVKFLRDMQNHDGTWPYEKIGATALAGLALVECGVPPSDGQVRKAAQAVRGAAVSETHTYSLALAILFLDRMGEPVDVALIEAMTVRLLAGQHGDGGWSYLCPVVDPADVRRLSALVLGRAELVAGKELPKVNADVRRQVKDLSPAIQAQLQQVARFHREGGATPGFTDNSNTQFAILALWVARRHGLPVEHALNAVQRRFRQTQSRDGGWGYTPTTVNASMPAMTCAGLLGLAAGYGVAREAQLRAQEGRPPGAGKEAGKGSKPADKDKPAPAGRPAPPDPGRDPAIVAGLTFLGQCLHRPNGGDDPGRLYYFLWSLERVAMAYGLTTIGNRDWYKEGCQILLANQERSGGWVNGAHGAGGADTCFALLFLRRSNLAADLTRALRGQVKDPGKAVLSQGGLSGAELVGKAPTAPASPAAPEANVPDRPAAPKPAEAKAPARGEATREQAAALGARLVKGPGAEAASIAEWDQALAGLRDGKGAAFTEMLADVAARLEGPARTKARQALAERLARMDLATLGDKLGDPAPEVRRAAALACAAREERTHLPRLIELLLDPDPVVQRGALAALKSLTGQDFGPARDAGRDEQTRSAEAWRLWWRQQKK